MAIQFFANADTEKFFVTGKIGKRVGWSGITNIVKRKLDMLHYAGQLNDLKSPPGNRLESLKGRLRGFYSIRVNDQWRIVFRWHNAGPTEVAVVDYH